MREIRFGGRRVDNGKWVYGYVWRNLGGTFIQSHEGNVYGGIHEVDPETVGQYTGVHDDSEEEVEIFEGDIVEIEYLDQLINSKVKYEGGAFLLVADQFYDGYLLFTDLHNFDRSYCWLGESKVIGNIHTHPHLLKGE